MDLNKLTLTQASKMLADEEISAAELVDDCLAHIDKVDGEIGAYLTVLPSEAKAASADSDKRRKEGKTASPVDGIPIAVKDVINTKGVKTTAASKILKNFVSPYDATVITKLKDAGAIILGKLNCDEFAMGSSTENSGYMVTKNPWDHSRVPGGSSGGSAAAVAANECLASLGSDTGGSIRQPASLCGVVGLKPTYGSVSRYGLMAMASSLDQIGPFGKTVEDVKILYDIISGYDPKDSTSLNITTETSQKGKFKIGVPKEYFQEGLDEGVKKVIEDSIEKLKVQGHEIIDISLPNQKYGLDVYYIIMFVEVSSNLARYDGIKFGNRTENAKDLMDVYFKSRAEGFGNEAKRRIIMGTYASSAGYIDQYYAKAQKVRTLIKKDFEKAFEQVDMIVGPVSPTVAFKIGEKSNDPLTMYLSDIYTISINLAGLPAISIPAGLSDSLPVGLQIIGPWNSENSLFALGQDFERSRGELPSPSL